MDLTKISSESYNWTKRLRYILDDNLRVISGKDLSDGDFDHFIRNY